MEVQDQDASMIDGRFLVIAVPFWLVHGHLLTVTSPGKILETKSMLDRVGVSGEQQPQDASLLPWWLNQRDADRLSVVRSKGFKLFHSLAVLSVTKTTVCRSFSTQ